MGAEKQGTVTAGPNDYGYAEKQAQIVIATAEEMAAGQATATAATVPTAATLSEPTTPTPTLALAALPDSTPSGSPDATPASTPAMTPASTPDYPAPIVDMLKRGRHLLAERRLLEQARREEIEAEEATRLEAEKKQKDNAWQYLQREIILWFGLDVLPWVHKNYAEFTADAKEHTAYIRFDNAVEIACKFVKVDERSWDAEPWVKRPAHAEQALFRVTVGEGQRYEYCHEVGMALARAVEVYGEQEREREARLTGNQAASSASRVLPPEEMMVEGVRLLVLKMMAEAGVLT